MTCKECGQKILCFSDLEIGDYAVIEDESAQSNGKLVLKGSKVVLLVSTGFGWYDGRNEQNYKCRKVNVIWSFQ